MKSGYWVWAAVALAWSTGVTAGTEPPAPGASEQRPPLIPVAVLAARDIFSVPKLSPDGRLMAVRSGGAAGTAVVVLDVDTRKPVARMPFGSEVEYNWHRWAGPKTVLVSIAQVMPVLGEDTRVSRLVALDAGTGEYWLVGPRALGPEGDDLLHVAKDGSSVLLSFQKSVYDWPSVSRVSLLDRKDKGEVVQRAVDGIWEWYADDAGTVRMGSGWTNGKLRVTYRKTADEKFREIARLGEDDEDALFDVQRIVGGADEAYVLDEMDDGRVVLARYDLVARKPLETVYRNDAWDVTGAYLDGNGKPIAVEFIDDRDRRVWLDPATAKLQKRFEAALKTDEVWIGSRTDDGSRMLVHGGGETDPGVLYLFDQAKNALDIIAEYRPGLPVAELARLRPIAFTARDGTKMAGYLTLPRGRTPKGLPMVILPHGGPYGVRDKLAYDDEVQLLANRGYAVLQPNYRGSGGYGGKFEELGAGQIGRKMQDDLDDAMDWAVGEGIADAKRVCLVGASYGGYAAMWGAIRNPERYRCAASFAGVSDWKKMLRYDAQYFSRKGARKWRDRVAGAEDFDLDSVAPAQAMGRLKVPLLVAHGKKDGNVPYLQFKLVENAAKASGARIETLTFEEAGHGFDKAEDEARWFAALEAFLARHNPAD